MGHIVYYAGRRDPETGEIDKIQVHHRDAFDQMEEFIPRRFIPSREDIGWIIALYLLLGL
jgi:hypothetical protein